MVSTESEAKTAPPIPELRQEPRRQSKTSEPSVQVVGTFVEGQGGGGSSESSDVDGVPSRQVPTSLKINQDLQLYKCRQLRHKAFYCDSKKERTKMLRQ
eukprot:scaffold562268_cov42-Prasinocladus_malaysianus.AAC.1